MAKKTTKQPESPTTPTEGGSKGKNTGSPAVKPQEHPTTNVTLPLNLSHYTDGAQCVYMLGKPTAAAIGDWVARLREYGRKQELDPLGRAELLALLPWAIPTGKPTTKALNLLTELLDTGALDAEPAEAPAAVERTDEEWANLLRTVPPVGDKKPSNADRFTTTLRDHYGPWQRLGLLDRLAVCVHHFGADWQEDSKNAALHKLVVGDLEPDDKDYAYAERLQKRWWKTMQAAIQADPSERLKYTDPDALPGGKGGDKPTTPMKKPTSQATPVELDNNTDIPTSQANGAKGSRYTIYGHPVTAVLRWMGNEQWTVKNARCILNKMGLTEVKDPTLHAQVGAGRRGDTSRGELPKLDPDQTANLQRLYAECCTEDKKTTG